MVLNDENYLQQHTKTCVLHIKTGPLSPLNGLFQWCRQCLLARYSALFWLLFSQKSCTQADISPKTIWHTSHYVCTRFIKEFSYKWFEFSNIAVWERHENSICKQLARNYSNMFLIGATTLKFISYWILFILTKHISSAIYLA